MSEHQPTNWQEEVVLAFPDDPFPRTAEEIRAKLLILASHIGDPEFRAKNIEQIKAFTEEELAGRLSDDQRLKLIRHFAKRCPTCHGEL